MQPSLISMTTTHSNQYKCNPFSSVQVWPILSTTSTTHSHQYENKPFTSEWVQPILISTSAIHSHQYKYNPFSPVQVQPFSSEQVWVDVPKHHYKHTLAKSLGKSVSFVQVNCIYDSFFILKSLYSDVRLSPRQMYLLFEVRLKCSSDWKKKDSLLLKGFHFWSHITRWDHIFFMFDAELCYSRVQMVR